MMEDEEESKDVQEQKCGRKGKMLRSGMKHWKHLSAVKSVSEHKATLLFLCG